MSKLLKLKEWLTVPEAAERLSQAFEEPVSEADIFRLALDGRIRLSIYLVNGARARIGKVVGIHGVVWDELSADLAEGLPGIPEEQRGKPLTYMKSLAIDEERYLNLNDEVSTVWDVWDIPMLAGDRLDIEHLYQQQTGGPAVTVTNLNGAFLERDGSMCQLMESLDENEFAPGSKAQLADIKSRIASEGIALDKASQLLAKHEADRREFLRKRKLHPESDNYYPAAGLPDDGVLVVKMKEILRLQAEMLGADAVSAPMEDEILTTKERTTLLVLIGLVAHLGKLDLRQLPKDVLDAADQKGIAIGRRTVEEKIKQVTAAMEARTR